MTIFAYDAAGKLVAEYSAVVAETNDANVARENRYQVCDSTIFAKYSFSARAFAKESLRVGAEFRFGHVAGGCCVQKFGARRYGQLGEACPLAPDQRE